MAGTAGWEQPREWTALIRSPGMVLQPTSMGSGVKSEAPVQGALKSAVFLHVLGLPGQAGQGVRGCATGGASVRSCQKLPPCLTESIPAGSKTEPLLAKVEPITGDSSASGMADLRRGKNYLKSNCNQRKEQKYVRTALQIPR